MECFLPIITLTNCAAVRSVSGVRTMLHRKACPRCSGDLSLVQYIGESYLSCLQCAFVSYQLQGRLEPTLTNHR